MEKNPPNISRIATILGRNLPSLLVKALLKAPKLSITGRVPSQNANIMTRALKRLAELNDNATKVYSQPHGKNVVTKPIKKGFRSVSVFSTFLKIFSAKLTIPDINGLLKSFPTENSCSNPETIRLTPTINADILPIGAAESIVIPAIAARLPRNKYVVNLPRLYSI